MNHVAWHACEFYGGPVDGLLLAIPDAFRDYRFAVHDPLPFRAVAEDAQDEIRLCHMVYRRSADNPQRFEWVGYVEL